MRTIRILYPERRVVSEDTVRTWASDSYYNGADWYRCTHCGQRTTVENGCAHAIDTPVYDDGRVAPETVQECIDWLSDTGEVTFAIGKDEAPSLSAA